MTDRAEKAEKQRDEYRRLLKDLADAAGAVVPGHIAKKRRMVLFGAWSDARYALEREADT
jgi:hypothetical protein